MLAEIFEKNHQFSSECLNPCNRVSIRHLVSSIISVFKLRQTLNHQKRIKSLCLFSSVVSYTQRMIGESKKILRHKCVSTVKAMLFENPYGTCENLV